MSMRLEQYNRNSAGKAWEIMGFTHEGSVYCPQCAPVLFPESMLLDAEGGENPTVPVFAVDEYPVWSCDRCGTEIMGGVK